VLAAAGLTDQDVARRITGWIAALSRDDAGGDGVGRDGPGGGVESGAEITEQLD
jgi:1-deoxy-D-xylulose-5-phosphate synthase